MINLTPSQRQALELAARGRTNLEIAREMAIAVATVATHVHDGMSILGVRRAEIGVRLAELRAEECEREPQPPPAEASGQPAFAWGTRHELLFIRNLGRNGITHLPTGPLARDELLVRYRAALRWRHRWEAMSHLRVREYLDESIAHAQGLGPEPVL